MAFIEYTSEEYTEACAILLNMRDCSDSYEERKAINIALNVIDRINWKEVHHG